MLPHDCIVWYFFNYSFILFLTTRYNRAVARGAVARGTSRWALRAA